MRSILFLPLLFLCLLFACQPADTPLPPTELEGEEDAGHHAARAAWEEAIHRAAPGTDWRRLEAVNAMTRHKRRAGAPVDKSPETFADGRLTGEWFELGSTNQAGSVFDVIQDPEDLNRLFIMSAGGAIWSCKLEEQDYSLVTHDIYFSREYFDMVPTPGGRHLIAYAGDWPMYSADDGRQWSEAEIFVDGDPWEQEDGQGFFSPIRVDSTLYSLIRLRRGEPYHLFRSTDGGRRYDRLSLPTDDEEEFTVSHLYQVELTGQVFFVSKQLGESARVRLYEMVADTFRLVAEQAVARTGSYRSRIAATPDPENDGLLRMYWRAYDQLWRSDDGGESWREMPTLESVPWRYVGVFVQPTNPDFVAYGTIDLFVSEDGGESFYNPNRWFEYYQDPVRYIHADVMRITEVDLPEGGTALLASNHGGLNRLEPFDGMWYSVAQYGLNVSQYYDVRTQPGNPRRIYLGSQDQGAQSMDLPESGRSDEPLPAVQFNSGDWGHLEFGGDGRYLFAAYPRGLLRVFEDYPADGVYSVARYEIESENEFIWISPMAAAAPREDELAAVYMAGGSAEVDGPGSYVIRVGLREGTFNLETEAENLPLNFLEYDYGQVSALGVSPLDADRLYAATTTGRFLYSEDGGFGWTANENGLPQGWYLYGQAIHASRTEAETVWLGGSGYSNDPVWRSTDGGVTFEPMSTGLPPTVVHGLAANADESLLFAATESGPFVFVAEEERWYDLTGQFAPTMRYYSVEYVEEINTVRYGTYGRGAWDLRLEPLVSTRPPLATTPLLEIYPNPAARRVTVTGPAAGLRIIDGQGREVIRQLTTGERTTVDVTALTAGLYFVQPLDAGGVPTALAQRLVVE